MTSDNKANSAVQDALGLGAGKVDTAYSAINKIKDEVDKLKTKLVSAQGASYEDQMKIATEIKTIQSNIKSFAANANYAGSNLLQSDSSKDPAAAGDPSNPADLKVVASYNRTGSSVTIDTVTVSAADTRVIDTDGAGAGMVDALLKDDFFKPTAGTGGAADVPVDAADIKTALEAVEGALGKLTTGAAALGAAKSQIDSQKSFLSGLQDSIEKGVGTLVDADMNKDRHVCRLCRFSSSSAFRLCRSPTRRTRTSCRCSAANLSKQQERRVAGAREFSGKSGVRIRTGLIGSDVFGRKTGRGIYSATQFFPGLQKHLLSSAATFAQASRASLHPS